MGEDLLIKLSLVLVLGIAAQWIAMRLKLPSILFLLVFGFLAGPVFGIIDPNQIFGELLFPIISLSVAVILFEGGMDLELSELREGGQVIRRLVSVGVVVTWAMATAAAYWILDVNFQMALLIGSIFVVTGPTVVGPLLRHIRPGGRVGDILKWEGILNDPIGVLIAVLVFESLFVANWQSVGALFIMGILKTVFLGGGIGLAAAGILLFFLRRYWIPDTLHQVVTLMFVIIAFTASNYFQEESGLLAVTLMGIVMANQKKVSVQHILEFKENLRVLIISFLFIILSARLELDSLKHLDSRAFIFLGLLIFVIRPCSVIISSRGSGLSWKEIAFISWMAPRGIVAAAMASIFAFELSHEGFAHSELLVPITFLVIVSTVALYGLTAGPLARYFGLAVSNPQGILILGAHFWARKIAKELRDLGFEVIIADTNRTNIRAAKKMKLKTFYGNIISKESSEHLDLQGVGYMLAMTSNDEANALAALRYKDVFGRANVYQLSPEGVEEGEADDFSPVHLRARHLFSPDMAFEAITHRFSQGAILKRFELSEEYPIEKFIEEHGEKTRPLFAVKNESELVVLSNDVPLTGVPGNIILVLDTD